MLPEFKKRIDTLRDILVGAVPSPAGQIEQITYALIYKFMSDIDDKATSIPGGKRTYFTGEYEKYSWHKIMDSTIGAHDRLTLYREALGSLAKNPGLPELFQGIYQNAYLTFNDPRVLTLFLKEIDSFKHSSSDDIGDAYEYLLQITGAQGDVGQFRTPRHIIKFIVEAVNPTKDDSVLDPAVGTAGFLIAAYNHVKHHHDGIDDITGLPSDKEKRLTSDEQDKMDKSYHGFDIDPTMVRTAKVNMYLHGFKTPDIINYNTLNETTHWNEHYDVILANPPFMSPKGGIKPHDKFGIVANRAEVLFVDYIASHLKPDGRAGIVVPEGIIFQSGKAYKELRKNLVDNYLYAVVSLPAGVFQPYSGVKTSVLLLDKELAKQRNEILFIKIENDGLSLGSKRREIGGGQFAQALKLIETFKKAEEITSEFSHFVSKDIIAESGDYNLSGDRYITSVLQDNYEYSLIELGNLVDVIGGSTPLKSNASYWSNGTVPWFTIDDIRKNGRSIDVTQKYITEKALQETSIKLIPKNSVLLCCTASVGEYAITNIALTTNQQFNALIVKDEQVLLPTFLYWVVSDLSDKLEKKAGKTSFSFVSVTSLKSIKIPLPSIEIQRAIISELDGYQKIIDAAQTIVKTYKPTIEIGPEWASKHFKQIATLEYGKALPSRDREEGPYPVMGSNGVSGYHSSYMVEGPGIIIGRKGSAGEVTWVTDNFYPIDTTYYIKLQDGTADLKFVYQQLCTMDLGKLRNGAGIPGLNREDVYQSKSFSLPSMDEQTLIVAELEAEKQLIEANKKLVSLYTQKIKSKIAEVWGE